MARRVLEVLGRSAGGTGVHVRSVVEGLDGVSGLTIDVAAPDDLAIAMPKRVVTVAVPNGVRLGHLPAIGRLRSVIHGGRYDVVHAHGLRAAIDCGLAAVGTPATVMATVHNVVPDARPPASWFHRGAEWLALRLSDKTLAASEEIAETLRRAAPGRAATIQLLHVAAREPTPARSAADVKAELAMRPGERLVVTAARLHRQKALDVLLHAIARLPGDVVLAALGEGPLEPELRSLARALGLGRRARFLGFREDVADFIAAADVFCLSSVWEAVSVAAKEAVLLGTPVVATDAGGMRELFVDKVSGRLVAPRDPQALAAALSDVLASEEDARLYAKRARAELERRFSLSQMLDQLERAYLSSPRAK